MMLAALLEMIAINMGLGFTNHLNITFFRWLCACAVSTCGFSNAFFVSNFKAIVSPRGSHAVLPTAS